MAAVKQFLSKEKISIFAIVISALSYLGMRALPSLRGAQTPTFLFFFFLAAGVYVWTIWRLGQVGISLWLIVGSAIVFRVILLFTEPSLSDDVYRYIWDGHLLNQGQSPYALPVNSPHLDRIAIPPRALVNHNWMASPYLPTAQGVFALITFIKPQSVWAFQLTAVIFDLLTGGLIIRLLASVGLRRQNSLIYFWHPLVIVEMAHGVHVVDALMVFLLMLAVWFLATGANTRSAIVLGAATLTKFLPILVLPIFFWRWNWQQRILFGILILIALGISIPGAGLGLTGPLDGTGIFGAVRIYLQKWNYNGGIYHWLEVWISGYPTPGAVPVEIVGEQPILITKGLTIGLLGIVLLIVTGVTRKHRPYLPNLGLVLIPLAAFLLLTATVHPWYVALVIPFFPFLLSKETEQSDFKPFLWAGIYFSITVALSYLTYLDPENLRETTWVRLVEYIPTYILLGWGLWDIIAKKYVS